MNNKPLVVIKIGGRAAEPAALASLAEEMSEISSTYSFIFVHGGGAEVSRISEIFGLKPTFKDGVRMTTPEEMDVVDMVLAGKMNKTITRLFREKGINGLGLSGSDGGLFTGEALSQATHTGKVKRVNSDLLELLCENGYLPVISSTSMETGGKSLNINADEAALAIAGSLPAKTLIFISDIPGILKPAEFYQSGLEKGEPVALSSLDKAGIRREIEAGVITGGMIPKVESAITALEKGVEEVIIGDYTGKGSLEALMSGKKGTKIIL
ncbi:MAG: acetylglutamate kinase [Spirochaetales bacterium]|nr:acetylglutamate kinase [Spirochaetales bacterium]